MEKSRLKRNIEVQATPKLVLPLSKSISLFSTAMILSGATLPVFAAENLEKDYLEVEPKITTIDSSHQFNQAERATSDVEQQAEQLLDSSIPEEMANTTESQEEANQSASESEQVEATSDSTLETTPESNIKQAATTQSRIIEMPVEMTSRAGSIPRDDFIASMGNFASVVAAENDLYASVMIAQAILESGWGSSRLALPPNYNLFGIKGSYQGQSVSMSTQEEVNGQMITITAKFRKYPSYVQSLEDNAYVLKNTSFQAGNYFYSGAWKSNTTSYRDATAWLTGRYATDSGYATKLNTIIQANNLTRFDSPSTGNEQGSITPPVTPPVTPPTTGTNYQVVAGDTLSAIGRRYGVTVANLKAWNKLQSDLIYVGQILIVSNGTVVTPTPPNETGTAPSTGNTYTVVAGDTLFSIGKRYGTSVANLKSWNKLQSDLIYIGQQLVIKTATPSQPTPNPGTTPSGNYTVVAGDTLSGIGQRYNVSVTDLKAWNQLQSDLIYVGQRLVIKSGTSSKPAESKPNVPTATDRYTVTSGDTLFSIGKRHGVTVANLKAWNKLQSDLIYVGQQLVVKNANTPTQKPTEPIKNGEVTYTVVSGDTLSGIARAYKTTVANLKTWNKLSNDKIYVGQKLVINNQEVTQTGTQQGAKPTNNTYKVKTGDTLWSIAKSNQVTVKQLLTWNSLTSDLIFVGQVLVIK